MSSIRLQTASGPVTYKINVTMLSIDREIQMSNAQLRKGSAHRPIRVSEQTLTFEVEWPMRLELQMENFSDAIRAHHRYCLEHEPQPMVFDYPSWRKFEGMIERAEKGVRRFQAKYRRTFSMRLWEREVRYSNIIENEKNPIVPSAADIGNYGDGWYDRTQHQRQQIGVTGWFEHPVAGIRVPL